MRVALALLAIPAATLAAAGDRMDMPLAPSASADRGRTVFTQREQGHCVICHAAPGVQVAGNVGPSLAGVGARLDAGQLRQRVVDITAVNPQAVMPAFHRTEGLSRVAPSHRGKTLLSAQQVEDVVAYLGTLK